ncbi:LLM class flavin-dependent oxidoreductase [Paenibacillus rigui]|uniref:LLM class flavin-dependent oxidoreductase n=1 Tax=Paenibacillus rigui TaxID=554312 RepID=A0A229UKF9_9BACL|nr:LLM class flavin-dependent oxidoreductase [Paenibacillus rigui]OXM83873.1 LLM class flavin-dependent oxidoreductase [Paenibacillus rigui]
MEFCWMLPEGDSAFIVEQTKLAEASGFHAVLLINANAYMDPWIMATSLTHQTEAIRILVAQNTSYCLPTTTAKAFNTLNLLSNGRIDLNIVTGSSQVELGKMTRVGDHASRYRRTKEFIELFRHLQQGGITHYHGDCFDVQNAELIPRLEPSQGKLFMAGSSEEAMQIAAQFADGYFVFGHEFEVIEQHFATFHHLLPDNRPKPKCGIMIDIIARETSEEAWQAAHHFLESASPFQKRMNRLFRNNCDSEGISKYQSYYSKQEERQDSTLWAGLSQLNTSNGFSIVGSYEEVRQSLYTFQRLGVDYFIVSGLISSHELERIGSRIVMPIQSIPWRDDIVSEVHP